jgi:hypothetical protein
MAKGYPYTKVEQVQVKTSNTEANKGRKFLSAYHKDTRESVFICWEEDLADAVYRPPAEYCSKEQFETLQKLGWPFDDLRQVTIKTSSTEANKGKRFLNHYNKENKESIFICWEDEIMGATYVPPVTEDEIVKFYTKHPEIIVDNAVDPKKFRVGIIRNGDLKGRQYILFNRETGNQDDNPFEVRQWL